MPTSKFEIGILAIILIKKQVNYSQNFNKILSVYFFVMQTLLKKFKLITLENF